MNRQAESSSLVKPLAHHNDLPDEFHMNEHRIVCGGHQFKDSVTFMTLTTPHFLNNMALWHVPTIAVSKRRAVLTVLNWCNTNFALITFGMDQHGRVSIVN